MKINMKKNDNKKVNESNLIFNKINIEPRKIKSTKFINKLILTHEKSKIKKKKGTMNQTILPFFKFHFNNNNKKSSKNIKYISPNHNTTQIISLAIPEIKETNLYSK